jgi:hypothetical protein
MRRSTLIGVLALVGVFLLLAAAGSAEAAPRVIHRRASFAFEARLPSSDGYSLYLRAKNHSDIELEVDRKGSAEPYVTMTYRVQGHVGRDGIKASLGRFGHVDLTASGAPRRELHRYPNCGAPRPEVRTHGSLVGTFRFRSLGGTVKSTVHHVEAETREEPRRLCTREARGEGQERSFFAKRVLTHMTEEEFTPVEEEEMASIAFLARAHTMGRTIDLYALGPEAEQVALAAKSTRRFGPVLVSTTIHAPEHSRPEGGLEVLITGKGTRPTAAAIIAPPPFSGVGTYTYEPGSEPTFVGSLAVRIPGEGTLPLAGPEFHAVICRFIVVKQQQACEETVAPAHTV